MDPPSPVHASVVPTHALAAAAERRIHLLPQQPSAAQLSAEHERRQAFRRLIDPGILRPNSKEQASASLKVHLCFLISPETSLDLNPPDTVHDSREPPAWTWQP